MQDFIPRETYHHKLCYLCLALAEYVLFLPGLGVYEIDPRTMMQFREVRGKQLRAVMSRISGDFDILVRKGRFHNQIIQTLKPIEPVPKAVIGGRITTECESAALHFNAISDGRDNMVYRV